MSKNRTGIYIGLAAAGVGGFYLYRAGGDVKGAKQEMKSAFSPMSLHDDDRRNDSALTFVSVE